MQGIFLSVYFVLMRMMPHLFKREEKMDSSKELFLRVCCIDENNPSLIELEAGLMQEILAALVHI